MPPRVSIVTPSLFNTNQTYLRVAALRRLVDRTDTSDPVQVVRRITEQLPLVFEDKKVVMDGAELHARQISQPFYGLLTPLARCDTATTTRRLVPGSRSSYAPLKHPADVRFAQLVLNHLQNGGDDLTLAPY